MPPADGVGRCGRQYCSASWLPDLSPVNLGLAKDQKLSLNPMQISGACGRLMCCLSYELAQYRDSVQRLPAIGTVLSSGQGPMTVVRTEVLQEAVWVRDDEGGEHRIAYADLPPGPYHKCGDCGCGKKPRAGNGGSPESEPPDDIAPEGGGDTLH